LGLAQAVDDEITENLEGTVQLNVRTTANDGENVAQKVRPALGIVDSGDLADNVAVMEYVLDRGAYRLCY